MSSNKAKKLFLSKLESYQDFLRNPENKNYKRGVYIWGFRFLDQNVGIATEFIPYYVGKDRVDIDQRIREHVDGIREGTHKILKKDFLVRVPVKYRSQKPEDHAFLNVHDKKRRKDTLSAAERVELIPHVNTYMDNLYITYIDVSHLGLHEKEEDKYIDYLERYVQNKIGPHRLSSKLGIKYPITFCPQIITSVGTETLFDKSAVQECLERHISKIKRLSNCNASTLHSTQEHAEVRICGIVTALREIGTRQGANMGFVTVEDITGCFQAVILPNVYAKCADFLREDEPLFFKGIYENSDESKLLCNEITLLNDN